MSLSSLSRRLELSSQWTLEGAFRTLVERGILLFNGAGQVGGNFILLEFYDGILYLVLDTGEGVQRFALSEGALNDGVVHSFKIERNRR